MVVVLNDVSSSMVSGCGMSTPLKRSRYGFPGFELGSEVRTYSCISVCAMHEYGET